MPGRNSSQPGKDSGQPGERLQTASKKLPPARKTLDGTHTSQLTSFTGSLLTPSHTLHLTLHTAPHFTDPSHTAPYLTSHTSHLTMTASLERTLANQARTPASQEETLISLEKTPASQEEQKNSSKLCRNASLPEKLRDVARMHAVRPSFG